ncbi:MAG: hypothetical protein HKO65_07970 [Gemmatimonadetes bacterium]|nr:hypothetical protein [Gemmatimonadota bacterium]NNM05027.1 hypothetical protein [Gemmatimonadota bacterium]
MESIRTTPIPFALLLALIPSNIGVYAQSLEGAAPEAFRIRTPVLFGDSAVVEGPSWTNRILSGLAGAAVGAGIGYFASQVASSDWEAGKGHSILHRPTWAAVGGAGGFALGFSIPIGGRKANPVMPFPFEEERFTISGDEVREAMVGNALEAVRLFHPEWLITRGQESFSGPDIDNVKAYMDNVPLGNVEALAGIAVGLVESIRFYDSRRATARWGMSHPQGVIQVITLGRSDPR